MRDAVAAALTSHGPDVITVEHDINAVWARSLHRISDVPLILTLHNVSSDYYRSRSRSASGLRAQLLGCEARRMLAYLRTNLPMFDRLVAVSDLDAASASRLYRGPISVVPNGAAVPVEAPDIGPEPIVLFTGTWSHPPNQEGALWFAEKVWPVVIARHAVARLVIAGRGVTPAVHRLASDATRIDVVGEVPAMAPYYADARVVVAPLLSGGGTRLKVLDALAHSRPVVATSVGMEGLELHDGQEIVVRDDANAFGEAILELLLDDTLARRIAVSGRRAVAERYAWSVLAAELESALAATAAFGVAAGPL
jgi:glycosyltransferase involved in cell wall biosynthesis